MAMRKIQKPVVAGRQKVQRRAPETKEDTCSGNNETLQIPMLLGYGCTKDAALQAVLAKLMTYVEANRKVKCAGNESCRAAHECITVIPESDKLEQKVQYNLARLRRCPPRQIGYEAVFFGTVESFCVCAPTEY
jgi:hypothetical protein